MNLFAIPWVELTILIPLVGAGCVWLIRNPYSCPRWAFGFSAAALVCALLAWIGHQSGHSPTGAAGDVLPHIHGHRVLTLDELNAPLLPLVALLHFLTVVATTGAKSARFSYSGLLLGESIRLAVFAVIEPWPLIVLLALGTVPPFFELRQRGRSTRIFLVHNVLFVVLLVLGWAFVEDDLPLHLQPALASIPLFLAVLVRSGTFPAHLWVVDLFENASFGNALMYVTPIAGVYAAVRLVVPVCPDWVLQGIGILSLVTAIYAAGLAIVQTEARRFFAYLFLSHASVILVGLELRTDISLTGALSLWFAAALSLTGLGLTLRAVEARFGRVDMTEFRGLYEHSPALAVCFLLTGLGSVGFPGTLGFVAAEMLVSGAVGADLPVGVALVLVSALNGIAVVRAYFLIFTGGRHLSAVPLGITRRERFAVLTLAALILGGGLAPQPGLESRHRAAEAMLTDRALQATSNPPSLNPEPPIHGP
jgi:NADH-quinone oxidoreductase subunit M